VLNPGGQDIADAAGGCNGYCNIHLANLPVGTYSIVVNPNGNNVTDSFNATLSTTLTAPPLTTNQAYPLNLARYGQFASLSFTGQAGQRLALSVANQATVPANGWAEYTVLAPDGTTVGPQALDVSSSSTATLNLSTLTQNGTYQVFVNPAYGVELTSQVTLVPGVTGTLAVGGLAQTFSSAVPEQNIYLTFDNKTAGANLGLGFSSVTPNVTYAALISVYNSAGTLIADAPAGCGGQGCNLAFSNLPAGTYSIVVVPDGDFAVGLTATLSANKSATLTPGKPFNVGVTRAGQNEDLAFTATAGQTATLQIAAQTTLPTGSSVSYYAYAVNGTTLTYLSAVDVSSATSTLTLSNLPAATSYLVRVNTDASATYTSTVTLGLQ
jgi:hypothetical protein